MLLYGGMDCRKEQLIKEFCVGKKYFYYRCRQLSAQEQMQKMGEEIQNAFQMKLSRYSYDEFFNRVKSGDASKLVIVIDEAQYAIKRDPEFVKSILKLKMKRLYPGPVMIILASSSIVWATQDAKDAFGDGFRRIDVLHKVEDLNFLEVVRTFPALSVSDCIRIYGTIGGVPGFMEAWNPEISYRENIYRLVLTEGGYLFHMAEQKISAELRELWQAKFEEEEEKDYKMSIFKKADDIHTAEPVFSKTFTIHKGIFQQEIWEATEAGEYKLIIYDKDDENAEFVLSELYFTVHPLETTWLENVTGTDWNAWENWSKGSPWTCTNVIIPESAQAYPILEADASNGCNYIHFEPNAEVKNTHHLDYKKAWVDIELSPNRYYMVAAPLKRIYSGDWFVAANGIQLPDTFTSLTANNYPENRVTPTIYQRIWDAAYMEQLINSSNRPFVKPGDKVDIAVTVWTKPFNWLATPYDKNTLDGQEFDFNALSVWVHPLKPSEKEEGDNGQTYTFRFPKEHTEYHYYDEKGTPMHRILRQQGQT